VNLSKQTVALTGLLLIVLILTASATGRTPTKPALGALGPILILGLMTWYLVLLILNRNDVIAAFAAILLIPGKNAPRRRSSLLVSLLGWALGTALYVSIIMGLSQGSLFGIQGLNPFTELNNWTPPGTQPLQLPETETESSLLQSAPFYLATAVFAAIGLVSSYILLQGLRLAVASRREGVVEGQEAPVELQQEVLRSVHHAIAGLTGSREYYETIIECYTRMCEILSKAGLLINATETPREFAQEVSAKLHIGGVAVAGLTFLFEEARYSNHQISEEKRIMAVRHLELLQQDLFEGSGSRA